MIATAARRIEGSLRHLAAEVGPRLQLPHPGVHIRRWIVCGRSKIAVDIAAPVPAGRRGGPPAHKPIAATARICTIALDIGPTAVGRAGGWRRKVGGNIDAEKLWYGGDQIGQ